MTSRNAFKELHKHVWRSVTEEVMTPIMATVQTSSRALVLVLGLVLMWMSLTHKTNPNIVSDGANPPSD